MTTYIKLSTYHLSSPIRIALVSDTHNISIDSLLSLLKSITPDIITICGDYVFSISPYAPNAATADLNSKLLTSQNALKLLTECPKIAPTFVSFGNHEWILSDADIATLFNTGSIILDNTYCEYQGVFIGGMTSKWFTEVRRFTTAHIPPFKYSQYSSAFYNLLQSPNISEGRDCYEWMDEFEKLNGYKIILSHHPQHWSLLYPNLDQKHIDLVLTGHAHGGQIRYYNPFRHQWQGVYSPDEGLWPKYTEGIHHGPYGSMIISRGLSNTSKIPRLFNAPELVLID